MIITTTCVIECNEECFCALHIILNYFLLPWFRDKEAEALRRLWKELKFVQLFCGRAGTLAQVHLMPEPLLTHKPYTASSYTGCLQPCVTFQGPGPTTLSLEMQMQWQQWTEILGASSLERRFAFHLPHFHPATAPDFSNQPFLTSPLSMNPPPPHLSGHLLSNILIRS